MAFLGSQLIWVTCPLRNSGLVSFLPTSEVPFFLQTGLFDFLTITERITDGFEAGRDLGEDNWILYGWWNSVIKTVGNLLAGAAQDFT